MAARSKSKTGSKSGSRSASRSSSGSRRSTGKESPSGEELLARELQLIHSAETQLARAAPRLSKAAQSQKLQQMLERRVEQGERILRELESAFAELDEKPGRRRNPAAEGLIADAREQLQEFSPGPALDNVLIGAIQKTEHYCIAAWGTAKSLADATERKTAVRAMERALDEGKRFDEELTVLAEQEVTPELLAQGSEEDEEEDEGESQQRERRSRRGRNGGAERRTD
jgi:ferritin-like metal-binding protein YciE